LALAGAGIGVGAALGYAALMMLGLRTWWTGAVATTSLALHVTPFSLVAGAVAALVAAMVCIWWTLRGLARVSERALLAGELKVAQRLRAPPAAVGNRLRAFGATASLAEARAGSTRAEAEGLRYERRSG